MRTIVIENELAYECKDYPNYYITKSGKLYSTYVLGKRGAIDISSPHLLKYGEDKDGYYRVVLSNNSKKTYINIHKLVVNQFIGYVEKPLVINHKDGNKHNNSVENLEIVTIQENTIHAHKNNLTNNEVPINVVYDGKEYCFNSLSDCMKLFPDISKHYLKQLRDGVILHSIVLFQKQSNDRVSKINAIYNGKLFKTFNNMRDADSYFNVGIGTTSSAIKYNEYRKKINKFIITFPNVSTIESAI